MIEIAGKRFPGNSACLTCEHVLSGSSVDHVFLDDEGEFQFLCDQPHSTDQARVVALGEVIDLDEELKNLPELSEGQQAKRNGISWVIC